MTSFFKSLFVCSKDEKSKSKKENKNTNKAIIQLSDYIGQVKNTDYSSIRYIIPSAWMYGLLKIKAKGTYKLSDFSHSIDNKQFLNKNFQMKDNIKVEDICLVIREFLYEIYKCLEVDFLIKIPLHSNNRIDLSEAVIYSKADFLNDKPMKDPQRTNIEELYLLSQNINLVNTTAVISNAKLARTHSKNQNQIQGNDISLKFNQDQSKGDNMNQEIDPNSDGVRVFNVESSTKGNITNRIGNNSNGFSTTTMYTSAFPSNKNKKHNTLSTNDQTYKSSTCSQNQSKTNQAAQKRSIIIIDLSQYKSMPLDPIGLTNPSVYCFMNTCLQCLASIPELNYYFHNMLYEKEQKLNKKLSACQSLNQFISDYNDSQTPMKPPSCIYRTCHSFLESGTQHDCQEFLRRFLGAIQDELNYDKKYVFPDNITLQEAWIMYRDVNASFVDSVFSGLMKSNVRCCECGHVSYAYDPILDLSLSIDSKSRENLKNCLKTYFQEEKLNCDYKCSGCKKKTSIKKRLEIALPPPILTIQFKRFGDNRRKINTSISFESTLSLEKYTSGEVLSNKTSYSLIAVAVHLGGSISSGHYIAYVNRNDSWYQCNDTRVSRCTEREALSSDAYLLFYRQEA